MLNKLYSGKGSEIYGCAAMLMVISANRLADGIVVYAGPGGTWLERLNEARVFASKDEAEAGLNSAVEDVRRNLIVDPCLVDIADEAGRLRPLTLRESIRARGPTVDFLPQRRATSLHAEGASTAKSPFRNPGTKRPPASGAEEQELKRSASLVEEIAQ